MDSFAVVAPALIPISTILVSVKWYWERLVLHKPTCYKKIRKKGIRLNKSSGDGARELQRVVVFDDASSELYQENPGGRREGILRKVYMLHFFDYLLR